MPKIRILIAHNKSDLPLSGVAETLSRLPDFYLIGGRILPIQEVDVLLGKQPADVVVLVGADSALEQLGQKLIDQDHKITVVRLTILPPTLQITRNVRQLGIGNLVDTLRTIARSSIRYQMDGQLSLDRARLEAS